ncbi:MAG TPA: HDIG domain-containing protein [Candidatus Omnitrophota bacterium]|nr:HDIG domain-containing protein [Candidatus Omnitrophota bacterium]
MRNTNEEKRKQKPEFPGTEVVFSRILTPIIFLMSAVLVCGIIFFGRTLVPSQQEFVLGEPALRSYFSPFSFSYIDEKKTEELRNIAVKNTPLVYKINADLNKRVLGQVNQFFQIVEDVRKEDLENGEIRWKKLPFQISTNSLNALLKKDLLEEVKKSVSLLLTEYLSQGILSFQERFQLMQSGGSSVLIVSDGGQPEEQKKPEGILTKSNALEEASGRLSVDTVKIKGAHSIILQIFAAALTENLLPDNERTQGLREKAVASVKPVEIKVLKGELLVQRGMLVTQEIKDRLDQINKKKISKKQQKRLFAGTFFIFLLYGLSYFYFRFFERKIFLSHSKVFLCHILILLNVVACKGIMLWPEATVYLMPVILAPLLLTLLLNNRMGLWAGGMMTVLGGFLAGFRPDVMLGTILLTVSLAFLAYRLRKRLHFIRLGLGMGVVYSLTIWGLRLIQNMPVSDTLPLVAAGFVNVLVTAVLSFLLLPVLEIFFDVITDVTLLELSDLNHPLIKKMMVLAPGTYHHSMVVSTLAEHACEVIGANALLAKVGSYFHDIGKIHWPEYFAENQGYLYPNLHEQLSPRMSFEIIVNHVHQGIRLSREYKLKKAILDFIVEHQGTGVVYYFYKKAMDQVLPAEHIRADDFRYPGPKPQSKETAVVLLSDSVEAASRSLQDASRETIQQLVRKVINEKFIDGQLDECELTLRDLHKIQESFIRNLMAIFHTRMKYPVIEKMSETPDLFAENQFSKFRVDDGH